MPNLQFAVEKLNRAQTGLLRAANSIAALRWSTPPNANSWSAAHLIAHLCPAERGVLGYADRVIRKKPLPAPVLRRFHIPFFAVEKRLVRRQSPIPFELELLDRKEAMLAELRGVA